MFLYVLLFLLVVIDVIQGSGLLWGLGSLSRRVQSKLVSFKSLIRGFFWERKFHEGIAMAYEHLNWGVTILDWLVRHYWFMDSVEKVGFWSLNYSLIFLFNLIVRRRRRRRKRDWTVDVIDTPENANFELEAFCYSLIVWMKECCLMGMTWYGLPSASIKLCIFFKIIYVYV